MGVLDMLNETLLLRMRAVCYAVLVFFSFFIFIGVAVMKGEFVGNCPLYSDVASARDGRASSCNYPIAVSILFQLLYLLFRGAILILLLLGKLNKEMFFFSDIMELVYLLTDCVVFFLTFVAACVLSAGHNSACDGRVNEHYCSTHAGWISASEAAQVGAWISTFVWLLVAVAAFLTLLRAGKIPCLRDTAAGSGSTDGGQQVKV